MDASLVLHSISSLPNFALFFVVAAAMVGVSWSSTSA